jgi:hypothetical protein
MKLVKPCGRLDATENALPAQLEESLLVIVTV